VTQPLVSASLAHRKSIATPTILPLQRIVRGTHQRLARSPATRRSSREIRQIKGRLEDLYTAVLEGQAERAAAAVANQIANTQLRAIELERRVREQDELEGRLDEVEDLLEEAERSKRHACR
jgi:hypothetical protein